MESINETLDDYLKSFYDPDNALNDALKLKQTIEKKENIPIYNYAIEPNELLELPAHKFCDKVKSAKDSFNNIDFQIHAGAAWRVSYCEWKIFEEEHPGAHCYSTKQGSTFAITPDFDIVSVCKHQSDSHSGTQILQTTIEKGGRKLDSYEGNYNFYQKNGFKPISWCQWNSDFKPDDWNPETDLPEDIIFFAYEPNAEKITKSEFKKSVPPSIDYDSAKEKRDDYIRINEIIQATKIMTQQKQKGKTDEPKD